MLLIASGGQCSYNSHLKIRETEAQLLRILVWLNKELSWFLQPLDFQDADTGVMATVLSHCLVNAALSPHWTSEVERVSCYLSL